MGTSARAAVRPYVRGAGEGEAHWYVNNRATIKASAADTGGVFSLVEMEVAVGHGPPLHVHHAEDEALWVLEGHLRLQCGDAITSVGPGSFAYIPRGIPHTFSLERAAPARLLVLYAPGGGEGFFIDAGRPAEGPGLPVPTPPDVALLSSVAAKYRMDFVGPPPAPGPQR